MDINDCRHENRSSPIYGHAKYLGLSNYDKKIAIELNIKLDSVNIHRASGF